MPDAMGKAGKRPKRLLVNRSASLGDCFGGLNLRPWNTQQSGMLRLAFSGKTMVFLRLVPGVVSMIFVCFGLTTKTFAIVYIFWAKAD